MQISNTRQIELLAPAGNLDTGIKAINCGADAVYIGPEQFGAREAAGNSVADIEKLCLHAHKYWARVYATVNTILREDELLEAQRLIYRLYDAGVDGIIIQDTGLLEIDLPPLPLIASTQMHITTPEKAVFLEKVGFDRIILARELSLDQIREIRRQTTIDLEFFVHGALCVCYSGQCYLSYAIGGRSGNRGQCAQPCRRRYRLEDGKGKKIKDSSYILSLKDLNLSKHLKDLIDAGITSFKIEGRLKDTPYVANAVGYYRQMLDRVLDGKTFRKSSSGKTALDFIPDPAKTFNRGFTDYFLKGRSSRIASPETPAWVGEKIGKVNRTGKNFFFIDSSAQVHNGDGICFFDKEGTLQGTHVNTAQARTIYPDKMSGIETGMIIYRNHDQEFLKKIMKSSCKRTINVSLTFAETGEGFVLCAKDEDGNRTECFELCEKKAAEKKEMARSTIEKQLRKLGETDFVCTNLKIDLAVPYFIPVQFLNSLRRKTLEALEAERMKNRPVKKGGAIKNSFSYPEQKLTYFGNVFNQQAEAFYRRHGVSAIEPAAESGLTMKARKVMTTKYCINYQLGLCSGDRAAPKGQAPLYLVDEEGRRLQVRFNCRQCVMELYIE